MLKAKPIKLKKPKQKKAKKPRVKKALPLHQERQASHYKTDQITTQGFFNPFSHNTGMAQSSDIPRATISGGGIPYTSTFESYGITNKSPYFLESFLPQNIRPNYEMPTQSKTATTISGANPMNEAKPKDFKEQGKSENIQYVDLVAPAKSGNSETQPDYIALQPEIKSMKDKLVERAEYRKKNEIPPEKRVSTMMKMEQLGFIKPKPSPSSKNSDVRKPNLRGKKRKQNDEL